MAWELELSPQAWPSLAPGLPFIRQPVPLAPGQSLLVGRRLDCDIPLPHRNTARHHARVWRDEGGVWVEDLKTPCRTWWQSHRQPELAQTQGPTRLEVDDLFRVGDSALMLTARFPVEECWRVWDCGVVPRLARAIQDGQSWGELPVLADALEESGCEEQELLRHFREVPHRLGWCAVLRYLLDG
jgi:hypothetical protein